MQYTIDGNKFNNYTEAYIEIKKIFTNNKIKENITIKEMIEQFLVPQKNTICVTWINSEKSKNDLGKIETIRYLKYSLTHTALSNTFTVVSKIKSLENNIGPTLFDQVIEAFDECGVSYSLE